MSTGWKQFIDPIALYYRVCFFLPINSLFSPIRKLNQLPNHSLTDWVKASFDSWQIQNRFLLDKTNGIYDNLHDQSSWEENQFEKTKVDKYLLSLRDRDLEFAQYRIYPLVRNFWSSNDFSYYHQSIGGYSPAKLRIVQDLMDFGCKNGLSILSRNISNMLNAKYFVAPQQLPQMPLFKNLELVFQSDRFFVYKNQETPGRAWFVGNYEVEKDKFARLERLKSSSFDINKKALLEKELDQKISQPQNASVELEKLNPKTIELNVKNDKNSLLVLSEIYYPIGWKAFVDGKETEIFKTNHVLRSIYVPAGSHNIKFVFNPKSLKNTHIVSTIGTILSFGLFAYGLIIYFLRKKRKTQIHEK